MDYGKCKQELDALAAGWDDHPENMKQHDENWVCVRFPKSMWRIAKAVGAEKDGYWGWILWNKSVQDNGSNFAVEVQKIAWKYGLYASERQL